MDCFQTESGIRARFRPIAERDLDFIFQVCEEQKWLLTRTELRCCFETMPDIFLVVADTNDQFMGCMNAVNINDTHCYIGIFIMRPEYRYKGLGKLLWNECSKKAGNRQIILTSPERNFEMYVKKGYVPDVKWPHHKVVSGRFCTDGFDRTVNVEPMTEKDVTEVLEYDADCVNDNCDRKRFLRSWLLSDETKAYVARKDATLVGFIAALQYSETVYRVSPLQADSVAVAKSLCHQLEKALPPAAMFTAHLVSDERSCQLFKNWNEMAFTTYYYLWSGATTALHNRQDRVFFKNHALITYA